MQATVGKYSTQLAREAKPSQRLLLELEYLQLAPPCIVQLRERNKGILANTLDAAWWRAHERLPALIFDATLGSDEYRSFWQPARAPGDYPRVSSSVAMSALENITHQTRRWLSGDYQADNRAFEVLLSKVAGGDANLFMQEGTRQSHCPTSSNQMENGSPVFPTEITALEAQLAAVLPLPYTRWINERMLRPHAAAHRTDGFHE